jgi:hypothetical protein
MLRAMTQSVDELRSHGDGGNEKSQKEKSSRHIVFDGEKLDAPAVWRVRDEYFPRLKKVK